MKNVLVTVVIAAVVIAAGSVFVKPTVINNLGAVSGPDDYFPCKSTNGVTTCSESKSFTTASSTLVSFKSPTATSTLRIAAGQITTATTSVLYLEWGRASVIDATTTSLGRRSVATGEKAYFIASTSPLTTDGQALDQAYVIAPNTYVNLKYGIPSCSIGAATPCNSLTGSAFVEFIY